MSSGFVVRSPKATTMYCLPSCSKVVGAEVTPAGRVEFAGRSVEGDPR